MNEYHIKCLKPELLTNYGFIEFHDRYEYTTTGNKEITVWKNCRRRRTPNKMVFTSGSLNFTIETLYLFVNLVNDKVITIEHITKVDRIKMKIDKLNDEIKKLKEELDR